ncbi:MAG: diaminopimelate epimerase [Clostridiales bacterium]|nr:diaminopimelate epimerase [Clostridiales bacterium]MDY4060868.1 diaminopimelate epimerase [Anaerovoracaceae bacterium]
MEFWKMNGAGNDFIIIDNRNLQISAEKIPELAEILCHRRFSIGADGFMVIENPSVGTEADFKMLFFNADGSLGAMCGNGARCISRYAYETGLSGINQHIETTAGLVLGERLDKTTYRVRLNNPTNIRQKLTFEYEGKTYDCTYMEIGDPGVPHLVVPLPELPELSDDELRPIALHFRNLSMFDKGVNINFYSKVDNDYYFEKTFEKGVEDFTYACGTGTASLVTALALNGETSGKSVKVDMAGGQLLIQLKLDEGRVSNLYLTGPTNKVCVGEITDDNIAFLQNNVIK